MPTRSEKIAIARIFADLIKADRIVDTAEMSYWRKVCEKYDIDKQIRVEARGVSFADAINRICNSGTSGLKEDLLGDCRAMTVSDGFCAHSEALLMIALSTMLEFSPAFSGEIYSIPRANFDIDIATALYIESEFYDEENQEIEDHYRSIFKEFQLAGFHFVYIPKIIDHYRHTDPLLFKDILSFLAPNMSDERVEDAYNALMSMTTGRFTQDLLVNRLGVTELRGTMPSLLIKIGNSFVGEDRYANYLKIDVEEDISGTVRAFVDRFTDMLSSDIFVVSTSEERDNQFHFHGFYKQLLDIFLVRKNIRSRVVVDMDRGDVCFPDIDSVATGLHRRERALYALFLCQGREGLNFGRPSTAAEMERYNRRMKKIQARYKVIYELFGGLDTAPDLSQPEIRRPIVSRLRRAINGMDGLYNPADYNIAGDRDGLFSVNVEPELIFVKESPDTTIPLQDSELYRRWKSID